MRLLLSSAVLGSGCWGEYIYRPGSPELLVEWIRAGAADPADERGQMLGSRIGYPLTAEYIQRVASAVGIAYRPAIVRASVALDPGQEGLVIRPRYRDEPPPLDYRRKQRPLADSDWEIGHLTRRPHG